MRSLLHRLLGRSSAAGARELERLAAVTRALQTEADTVQGNLAALTRELDAVTAIVEQLVSLEQADAPERASFAAVPAARLRSALLTVEGAPSLRLRVRRHTIGRDVGVDVRRSIRVESCVTRTAEVRNLWNQLLASEAACADTLLRGEPATVLDIPECDVAIPEGRGLHVRVGTTGGQDVVALPRFAYDFPARKLRNFGHWLLDCVPQVLALARLAPSARFLLPEPARDVHWLALELAGVSRQQVVPWRGESFACRRLLVQETDGRVARGRPLPQLLELRQHVREERPMASPGRRIYVSRRDAKKHRQWMSTHDQVEAFFRSRGFEILVMRESSLDAQLQAFRDARVVAGVSGAGLANIIFSEPGAHVLTLLTDSLMHWYAEERGSRSAWANDGRAAHSVNDLSDSPRFYPYLAAVCDQYSHTLVCEDEVPLGHLETLVDEVLKQVGRD